jgi:hypothetical protein
MFFEATGSERSCTINAGTWQLCEYSCFKATIERLQKVVRAPGVVRLSTRHIVHISIDLWPRVSGMVLITHCLEHAHREIYRFPRNFPVKLGQ